MSERNMWVLNSVPTTTTTTTGSGGGCSSSSSIFYDAFLATRLIASITG
jgi:hypothetical protein